MKFCRVFKYDMKNGYYQAWRMLLVISILIIIFCIEFYGKKKLLCEVENQSGSYMDYVLSILAGMKPYVPSMIEKYSIPVKWLLLHCFIFCVTLNYSYRDLVLLGKNVLPNSGNRCKWWLSKVLWNICIVVSTYIQIFLITLICWCFFEDNDSIGLTFRFVNEIFVAESPFDTYSSKLYIMIMILPIMISIAFSLVQMALTLYVKPIFSFGIICIVLLLSAYFYHPLFLGNYMMPIRSCYVLPDGMEFFDGAILAVVVSVGAVLCGIVRFRKMDIM